MTINATPVPYHYTLSGLDNVFLMNGFNLENDPHYGELVSFRNLDGLHHTLDRVLLEEAPYLTGDAMRLLRSNVLELAPEDFAPVVGLSEENVRTLEKRGSQPLPYEADNALRFALRERVGAKASPELTEDQPPVTVPYTLYLTLTEDRWTAEIVHPDFFPPSLTL